VLESCHWCRSKTSTDSTSALPSEVHLFSATPACLESTSFLYDSINYKLTCDQQCGLRKVGGRTDILLITSFGAAVIKTLAYHLHRLCLAVWRRTGSCLRGAHSQRLRSYPQSYYTFAMTKSATEDTCISSLQARWLRLPRNICIIRFDIR
jgi:hypothetical protein